MLAPPEVADTVSPFVIVLYSRDIYLMPFIGLAGPAKKPPLA